MGIGDFDRFYRNPSKFNLMLQRLRSQDDIVKYRSSNSSSSSNESGPNASQEEDSAVTISEIRFLNDPSTDNDVAAGELGDALQVQLQNVLALSVSSSSSTLDDDNIFVVDVVNHLEIVIENMSTDFEKYQSLLQYIANHRNNPYLESITIVGQNPFNEHPIDHDSIMIQQRIVSEFLFALLPTTASGAATQQQQQPNSNTTSIGLQRLEICGCHGMNPSAFVTFIQKMSIPIFDINCLTFFPTDDEINRGVCDRQLPDEFQNNTSIHELYFEIDQMTLSSIAMVLKKLMYNTSLRRLRLEWSMSIFDFIESDIHGNPIVVSDVQEFVQTLAQYIAETQTLQHIELIHFQFLRSDILQLLLTSISSNRSIQVLTLSKCSFDHHNTHNVFLPQLQHLRMQRFELDLIITTDPCNYSDLPYFIYHVLPSNIFIQEICVIPEHLPHGRMHFEQELVSFLRFYLHRNRGLQLLIQQYVKATCTAATVVNLPISQTDGGDVTSHGMFDVNHHSFRVSDSIHAEMQNQRRIDHQYHNVQQKLKQITNVGGTLKVDSDANDTHRQNDSRPNKNDTTIIPIELIPTILANHFSLATYNHYGPTIIYHIVSNLGRQ